MSTERLLSTSKVLQHEDLRATSSAYIYLVASMAGKS